MAVAEALTPARLWQRRRRGSQSPPSAATAPPALRPPPIPAAGAERRAEQRRGGGHLRRGPRPCRPRFAPGPRLGRGAGAAFSLSPPSQKQRDSLSFIFYLINFHFLHKTSNCKYF